MLPREALGQAILDAETARENLADARFAAGKAAERLWDAQDRLEALRREQEAAGPGQDFISVLALGGNVDVLDLARPDVEAREKLEAAEAGVASWRGVQSAAEAAVEDRARVFGDARRRVDDRAKDVVLSSIDVALLIREAAGAREVVLAREAVLQQVIRMLPAGMERKSIEDFLARPWLLVDWRRHPAAAAWQAAHEALGADANAPLPA